MSGRAGSAAAAAATAAAAAFDVGSVDGRRESTKLEEGVERSARKFRSARAFEACVICWTRSSCVSLGSSSHREAGPRVSEAKTKYFTSSPVASLKRTFNTSGSAFFCSLTLITCRRNVSTILILVRTRSFTAFSNAWRSASCWRVRLKSWMMPRRPCNFRMSSIILMTASNSRMRTRQRRLAGMWQNKASINEHRFSS